MAGFWCACPHRLEVILRACNVWACSSTYTAFWSY